MKHKENRHWYRFQYFAVSYLPYSPVLGCFCCILPRILPIWSNCTYKSERKWLERLILLGFVNFVLFCFSKKIAIDSQMTWLIWGKFRHWRLMEDFWIWLFGLKWFWDSNISFLIYGGYLQNRSFTSFRMTPRLECSFWGFWVLLYKRSFAVLRTSGLPPVLHWERATGSFSGRFEPQDDPQRWTHLPTFRNATKGEYAYG